MEAHEERTLEQALHDLTITVQESIPFTTQPCSPATTWQ